MNKVFRFMAVCTFGIVLTTSSIAWAQTYTSVDYPGAIGTNLSGGPNPQGIAVGEWLDAGGTWHGLVYHNGVFTSFDPPGSTYTVTNFITPQGVIVGQYNDSGGVSHGFLLTNGQYTKVDYPNAAGAALTGMNPSGEISGYYCVDSACTNIHGFTRSKKGQFAASFEPPGALESVAAMVIPSGAIVVDYWTDSPPANAGAHCGLLYHEKFANTDFPGGTWTICGGANASGDIVGETEIGGMVHAFLLSNGVFTSFDYPGATLTVATGINPGGIIGGFYLDAMGNWHGFIRTP